MTDGGGVSHNSASSGVTDSTHMADGDLKVAAASAAAMSSDSNGKQPLTFDRDSDVVRVAFTQKQQKDGEVGVTDDTRAGDGTKSTGKSVTSVNNRRFTPYIALSLSFFAFVFCVFLVRGAACYHPTHLLPFFFLQVFDFIISLLTVVSYMSATSEVRVWFHTKVSQQVCVCVFTWSCHRRHPNNHHHPDRHHHPQNGLSHSGMTLSKARSI